jgi:hypothetical protein
MPPLSEAELQEMVDRLAIVAGVDPPRVFRWTNDTSGLGTTIGIRYFEGGWEIGVGDMWFDTTERQVLCLCQHSLSMHRPRTSGGPCTEPGCQCDLFRADGASSADLQRQSLEAILAHEIGHLVQRIRGRPLDKIEADYDVDTRAVSILGEKPEQMMRALRLTAHFSEPDGTTHPTNEQRAVKVRERWLETSPGWRFRRRFKRRRPLRTGLYAARVGGFR